MRSDCCLAMAKEASRERYARRSPVVRSDSVRSVRRRARDHATEAWFSLLIVRGGCLIGTWGDDRFDKAGAEEGSPAFLPFNGRVRTRGWQRGFEGLLLGISASGDAPGCSVAFSECPAQTRERAGADSFESDPKQRAGELERALQREICVVGDSCAPLGGLEGDPVQ